MMKGIIIFMIVSIVSMVSMAAGYDIQFVHNQSDSGYTIIISDDYGKEVKVPVSQKEMMLLTENPTIIDSTTHKERKYLDAFVESVRKHANKTLY